MVISATFAAVYSNEGCINPDLVRFPKVKVEISKLSCLSLEDESNEVCSFRSHEIFEELLDGAPYDGHDLYLGSLYTWSILIPGLCHAKIKVHACDRRDIMTNKERIMDACLKDLLPLRCLKMPLAQLTSVGVLFYEKKLKDTVTKIIKENSDDIIWSDDIICGLCPEGCC